MLKLFKDSGFTQNVKNILGKLENTGITFSVNSKPSEVRLYTDSIPWGQLLSENTTSTASLIDGEWFYDSGNSTVTLGGGLSSGENVIAFDSGEFLFDDVYFTSNLSEIDRTKEKQIWIRADDYDYLDITCTAENLISNGVQPDHIQLSLDNSGTPMGYQPLGDPLTIPDIMINNNESIWVKVILPQDFNVENYKNIYLKLDALERSSHV